MKKIYLHGVFILITLCAVGQDLDYYRALADTTHNTTIKLVAIDSVLSKTYTTKPSVFITYSLQYIDLAKSIDSIELAAKKAMNLQGVLLRQGEARKSITVIDGVLFRKNKIKDSFLLGGLYLKKGGAYYVIDAEKAIENYTLAIQHFSKTKDSIYVADAYLFRGQAYSNLGRYVPAGKDFNTAYKYYEQLEDYEYMLFAQQGNIIMFSQNGFYQKAISEREKLIAKLTQLELTQYLPIEYTNQSIDFNKIGDKVMQLQSLQEAKKIVSAPKDSNRDLSSFIYVYSKLAQYYSENGDFNKAWELLNELEKYNLRIGSDKFSKINYNSAFAVYYFEIGYYETALKHAKEQFVNAKELNHTEAIMDAHLLLANIYEKRNDYKKSLLNKNSFLAMRDSIKSKSAKNTLVYYQTLYETEKKEKELALKNANIALLESKNKGLKKTGIFLGLAIILFFGYILLYRNQKNLQTKKELQEKFSQKLIQSQEDERKRISSELHDSIGQRLLLLKNRLFKTPDEPAKKMVEETIEEVRTISRNLYPFQLQELGITKAVEQNISQIDENTSLFISSEIDDIDDILSKEKEVNLYRIIQESLNNIIKHAKAKAGKVHISKTNEHIFIKIKDNGKGFDFQKEFYKKNAMGLKTLLERTKYLNGQVTIHSGLGKGTQLDFKIPIS